MCLVISCGRFSFEEIDASLDAGMDAGDAMIPDAAADAPDGATDGMITPDGGDAGGPPVIHVVPNETLLATGALHTCVGLFGRVYCWGDNTFGQLGDNTTQDRSGPTQLRSINNVVALQLGEHHSCALTRIGEVFCWGRNDVGQLGIGNTIDQLQPTLVEALGSGVKALWLGPFNACARAADDRIMCWGKNDHSQLGDGTTTMRTAPVAMNGANNITTLALGADMTCALRNDQTVACRGYNVMGQLGNGSATDTDQAAFAPVVGVMGVRQLTAGHQHACAVATSGAVRCWGDNRRFTCGNGSTEPYEATPVAVTSLHSARSVTASERTSCAIDESGVAKCWGASIAANSSDRAMPTALVSVTGAREVHAGRAHQCVRAVNNYVHCVGDNSEGQLGDGTRDARTVTNQVLGLPAPVSGPTPSCGDEFIGVDETCDDGHETTRCNANCTLSRCGDGVINETAGETCETGDDLDAGGCLPDCTLP